MTHIYFVRHAQPDLSVKDNYIRPLSNIGFKDANLVCDFLSDINIDVLYSSTYLRSYQTIEPLAKKLNKSIIQIDALKERLYGKRNVPIDEYFYNQWHDFSYKCEDGESLNDCTNRNLKVINELLQKHKNQNIVIGYHGTNLCALLHYYDSSFNYNEFLKYKPLLPLVIKITFDGEKFIKAEELFKIDRDYEDSEKLI